MVTNDMFKVGFTSILHIDMYAVTMENTYSGYII